MRRLVALNAIQCIIEHWWWREFWLAVWILFLLVMFFILLWEIRQQGTEQRRVINDREINSVGFLHFVAFQITVVDNSSQINSIVLTILLCGLLCYKNLAIDFGIVDLFLYHNPVSYLGNCGSDLRPIFYVQKKKEYMLGFHWYWQQWPGGGGFWPIINWNRWLHKEKSICIQAW